MTTELLKTMLIETASAAGWRAIEANDFTATNFRSRPRSEDDRPIPGLYGLRLGDYPVLVAPIRLDQTDTLPAAIKQLHSQMVVARSYMEASEVINAHLFLCATSPTQTGDWSQAVDLIERDEAVCRKVVWIPKSTDVADSYRKFVARTFLAMPWMDSKQVKDVALDQTHELAERLLVKHGLKQEVAARWVQLAVELKEDPDSFVAELVAVAESNR
jgi:hypothetical protein